MIADRGTTTQHARRSLIAMGFSVGRGARRGQRPGVSILERDRVHQRGENNDLGGPPGSEYAGHGTRRQAAGRGTSNLECDGGSQIEAEAPTLEYDGGTPEGCESVNLEMQRGPKEGSVSIGASRAHRSCGSSIFVCERFVRGRGGIFHRQRIVGRR